MKTNINRLLKYQSLVLVTGLAVFAALWTMPGTARGQMFVSVNSNPFTNGGSFVRQYDSSGNYTTFLSNLDHPREVAFDNDGHLYVATFAWILDSNEDIVGTDHGSILKVNGGVVSTFATFSGASAHGLAIDSDGNVFASSILSDNSSSTIYKVDKNGTVNTFGSVPGQCFSLAFDNAGNLFAGGFDSTLTYGTIYKFTSGGARSIFVDSIAFSSGDFPIGLTFDSFGNLFVSTNYLDGTGKIRSFDSNGMENFPPFATGLTKNPRGLAFDSDSNLFCAEIGAGAAPGDILKFDSNGVQSVFATEGFGTRQNRGPEYITFAPPAGAGTAPSTAVVLTFPGATEPLTTTVVDSLDQNTVPLPSPNFELTESNLAFDITTPTGEPTPPIIIAFTVSSSLYNSTLDSMGHSTLKVMHYEHGIWVDRTIDSTDPNYPLHPADYTIYGKVTSFSPFLVTKFKYGAQVQQPINADGTSVFNARRGVIPVAFKLTSDGVATCQLPSATISVFRTSGGVVGSIDESVYLLKSDSGSNFRIDSTKCQYVYNLGASSLGAGTYQVNVSIGGSVAGSATFALK